MTTTIAQLETIANGYTNSVVRDAALSLVEIARSSGEQHVLDRIGTMFGLSATGQGTAIFYAGTLNGVSNEINAKNVRDNVLDGNGYLWSDTVLGQYIDTYVTERSEQNGYLPTGTWSASVDYLSARMAAEAQGPAVACVAGVLPNDYSAWLEQELPATGAGSDISSFNGVPVSLVVVADPVAASQMISQVYDCTTGDSIPDPEFAAAVLGLPAPEPGLESPLLPSLLLGGMLAGAGSAIVGGVRLAGQGISVATEGASGYATTAAGHILRFFGVAASDGTSGGIGSILTAEFSGVAGLVPDALVGTAFENFLPSTLLNANGGLDVDWDWSTINLSDVTLAASLDTSSYSFNYITVPGITVTSTAGDWKGTFAQTSDGVPIFQIAADSYGITQTATAHADGSVTVLTSNGSTTGQFNYAGPVDANADPLSYTATATNDNAPCEEVRHAA